MQKELNVNHAKPLTERDFTPTDWKEVTDWTRKIYTYSGYLASPENPPPLRDMAICKGRLPRFCGNTQQEWVVLAHEINVANVCRRLGSYYAIPHALVHDGSESLLGDIPTPNKTQDMRALEDTIISNVYLSQGLDPFDEKILATVKYADAVSLVMEAERVLIPNAASYFTEVLGSKLNLSEAVKAVISPVLDNLIYLCSNSLKAFRPGGFVIEEYVKAVERMTTGGEEPREVFDEFLENIFVI